MSDLPESATTRVKGPAKRLSETRELDDKIVFLVEGRVDEHKLKTEGLTQVVVIEEAYPLTDDESIELLRVQRSKYRVIDDDKKGLAALAFDDSVQPSQLRMVDGVLMTTAEIAERRGEDIDPSGDELTVEFVDGTRGLWPDDWAGTGQSLAYVGGFMRTPTSPPGETVQVVRYLNLETGEPISEWSEEDEADRLASAEEAALVEEAKADREVVEDLEAKRAAKRSDSVAEFPGLPAKDAIAAVEACTDLEVLTQLEDAERDNKNRQTVLSAIAARQGALDAKGPFDDDEDEFE